MKSFLFIIALLGLGSGRSPEWRRVRAEHLSVEPQCALCGTVKKLEVHHVVLFSADPARELDPANLITLCDRNCHYQAGHAGKNWKTGNPRIRDLCGPATNSIGLSIRRIREAQP